MPTSAPPFSCDLPSCTSYNPSAVKTFSLNCGGSSAPPETEDPYGCPAFPSDDGDHLLDDPRPGQSLMAHGQRRTGIANGLSTTISGVILPTTSLETEDLHGRPALPSDDGDHLIDDPRPGQSLMAHGQRRTGIATGLSTTNSGVTLPFPSPKTEDLHGCPAHLSVTGVHCNGEPLPDKKPMTISQRLTGIDGWFSKPPSDGTYTPLTPIDLSDLVIRKADDFASTGQPQQVPLSMHLVRPNSVGITKQVVAIQTLPQPLSPPFPTSAAAIPANGRCSAMLDTAVKEVNSTPIHGDGSGIQSPSIHATTACERLGLTARRRRVADTPFAPLKDSPPLALIPLRGERTHECSRD